MISDEVNICHITNRFRQAFLSLMNNPRQVLCHQLKMVFLYSISEWLS